MLATFSMHMYAVDFWESVILDGLHYRSNQSLRCGFDITHAVPNISSCRTARKELRLGMHLGQLHPAPHLDGAMAAAGLHSSLG